MPPTPTDINDATPNSAPTEQPWYEAWFDRDEYEIVYQNRNDAEATHLIELVERVLAPQSGADILDVGCGRGRHAIALAHRGYNVTGLDLSPRALTLARRRAAEEGVDVAFVEGDMREWVCPRCFDGVVNLFTSFGYFEHEAEHQQAINTMASALEPGGWLVQDFLNAEYAVANLVPYDRRETHGLWIEQQRRVEGGRLNKRITLHRGEEAHDFHESVCLLRLPDFEQMYAAARLRITHVYGDYDGSPFSADTPRLILFAEKY